MPNYYRVCRNGRCQDEFASITGEWFCPSCRLAIAIGLKWGALVAGPVAALLGFAVGYFS